MLSARSRSWRSIAITIVACVVAAWSGSVATLAAPADPWRVIEGGGVPPDRRLEPAVTLDGYHRWEPPSDLAAWKLRRERTRRQVLVAAGLWPMLAKTPLAPAIWGRVERDDYTVEKVFFASHPGHFVTGNLYRPRGDAGGTRRPAVLTPHGHWNNGRFYRSGESEARAQVDAGKERTLESATAPLQARCVGLARLGCVVFHYDMIGYADSQQVDHRKGFGDTLSELWLESWFGIQTWNTIRAFDFLASLPDVDPARIGVTGASGGGTQTFILGAIDDRPAALFPAVMVSADMQGGCVCENASHLRVGTTNIEFAALAAPKPCGLTGANDWTRDILTKGLPELKSVWGLHGKPELVEAWHHPEFEHNYNQVSREHMYEWFNRHLALGHASPIRERPFEPLSREELTVFDDEHRLPASAVDAGGLHDYWRRIVAEQIAALEPTDAASLAEYRRVVGAALETLLHTSLPAPEEIASTPRGETRTAGGYRVARFTIGRRGSGEAVPALFIEPSRWNGNVGVATLERGKGELFARDGNELTTRARDFLDGGLAIVAIDAFLTGEYLAGAGDPRTRTRKDHEIAAALMPKDGGRHAGFVGYTYGYNRTLIAQRAHDTLTAIAFARSLEGVRSVRLGADDGASSWALLALALAGRAVDRAVFEVPSFAAAGVDPAHSCRDLDDPRFLPGLLRYGGFAGFGALCAPTELALLRAPGVPPVIAAAYRAAGKPDLVRAIGGRELDAEQIEALRRWISE